MYQTMNNRTKAAQSAPSSILFLVATRIESFLASHQGAITLLYLIVTTGRIDISRWCVFKSIMYWSRGSL